MRLLKSLPVGIGLSLITPAQAVDSNLYLIALAGQSNMTGAGDVKLLPVGFPTNGPRIWNFTNADAWEPAREPIDSNSGQVDAVSRDGHPGVGPALAMADAFTAKYPNVSVGLIPCGKSGSSIEKWQPDKSRDSLYGSCLYRQKQAGLQGRLRALVFWQGGQDGKDKKTAKHWGENFKAMVKAWRADVGDPERSDDLADHVHREQRARREQRQGDAPHQRAIQPVLEAHAPESEPSESAAGGGSSARGL